MKFTFTKQQPEFTFQLVEKSTSACGLSQGYQKEIIIRRKRRKQQRRFMDDVIEGIQWVGVTEEAGDRVR